MSKSIGALAALLLLTPLAVSAQQAGKHQGGNPGGGYNKAPGAAPAATRPAPGNSGNAQYRPPQSGGGYKPPQSGQQPSTRPAYPGGGNDHANGGNNRPPSQGGNNNYRPPNNGGGNGGGNNGNHNGNWNGNGNNKLPPQYRPPPGYKPPPGYRPPPGGGYYPPPAFYPPGGRYPPGHYPPAGGWYRPPVYYAPWRYPSGYYYRPWSVGLFLPSLFLSSAYYFNSYQQFGLGAPPYGTRWVRYGPDLLLVEISTGRIRAVYNNVFLM